MYIYITDYNSLRVISCIKLSILESTFLMHMNTLRNIFSKAHSCLVVVTKVAMCFCRHGKNDICVMLYLNGHFHVTHVENLFELEINVCPFQCVALGRQTAKFALNIHYGYQRLAL